jgi:uncharacterized membrane protein
MFFHPLVLFMMLTLVVSVLLLFFVVQIGIISYAFDKIGVPSEAMFSLLLLSWVGSWVHIPLARVPAAESMLEGGVVRVFSQRYVVPQWRQPRHTVLAVNVGGAVVPTLLSLSLLTQALAPLRVVVATVAVTLLTSRWARPVAGVGIVVPMLLPPLSAALAAPPATASAEGRQFHGAPSSWCRSKPRWPRMWPGLWAPLSVATCSIDAR